MTTDIKPDTSLYPYNSPEFYMAMAEIVKRGGEIQSRRISDRGNEKRWDASADGVISGITGWDHRLKPEPRVVWVMQNEDGSLYEGGLFKVKPLWPVPDCKVIRFVESPE